MGAIATEQAAVRSDRARVLPWVLWVLTVVIAVSALVLFGTAAPDRRELPGYVAYALAILWAPTAGLIGSLITSKRRKNRIGWLLVAVGLLGSYVAFASGASETTHPAADALNILSDLGWGLFLAIFALFILLFPDGQAPSRRWHPVIWFVVLWPILVGLMTLAVAPEAFLVGSSESLPGVLTGIFAIVTFIAIGSSAVLRFTRSAGTERQQLKWFAYGTAIGLGLTVTLGFLPVWGAIIGAVGLYGPLAGTAVALFRHRLYDIDELISRTFVYGALVAILAGLYSASIRFFNAAFENVTGIGSEGALVITTLILATTLTPIKKRLEEIVEARYKTPESAATEPPADVAGSGDVEARLRAIVREELERAGRAR